ncbi:uncharacterized protein LOC124942426 isoform X2 [Impatiens glandulifera]|uniref:uncharacterized protein LOC124942426 isoform X2 n=1 Tax=Impatiens glandulifera TaxID=253017 RepID=UPI001FB16A4D|nr:uncharacterized protein LOC124942426 isoform X2 [Impatiens glandulifera]
MGSIFTLMLSVKYACKFGFFLANDSEELLTLTNEIESSFCVGDKFSSGNDTLSNIRTIMSRFYPWLKIEQILTCIEVESGYGFYVKDFFIPRTVKFPTGEIRFLVARTDLMENSSCLINPLLVNFLLNGTTVTLDKGPQMPIVVTSIMAYGVNLLQAVGEFNGNSIIIVAVMSPISSVSIAVQDYVAPVVTSRDSGDSDPEIAKGASRISLNCPISFNCIKTPVKGQSCNHHQLDQRNRTATIDQSSTSPHFSAQRVSKALSHSFGPLPLLSSNILQRPITRPRSHRDRRVQTPSPSRRFTSLQLPPLLPPPPAASELERKWRPTGRMRGSLSGQEYIDAYSQFITRPPHVTTTTTATSQASSSRTPQMLSGITFPPHMRPPHVTTTTAATSQVSSRRTPQELSGITIPPHMINARNKMAQVSQTQHHTTPMAQVSQTQQELSGITTPLQLIEAVDRMDQVTTPLHIIESRNRLARVSQTVQLSATNGESSSTPSQNLS